MSQVAADFQTQASSAVVAKASRQSSASQKTQSSRFDDLLSAIPDAPPPEPRARAKADALERPQPAEARSSKRDERPDRTSRDDRPARTDRTATSDPAADDSKVPAADAAPTKNTGATETDTAAPETKSADSAASDETKSSDTDTKAADGETTDATAVTQAAVEALVPQAVAIDPAAAALVAEPTVDGEAAAKTGAAKAEAVTAATQPSTEAAKQQATMLADQSTGLSADDAEVLSALAAKAQEGLKGAADDKPDTKASGDKPAHAAKADGEPALTGQTGQAAQAEGTEAKGSEAKPVHSDLAKIGVEHRPGKADSDAKPADHAAQGINVNSVAPKTDGMQLQNFSAILHQTHTTGASASANGPASISSDDKAVSISNVPVEISAKIASGKNQFDIRLDPEELGRIHVKVNVDRDGNITTHMVADRPDTLDLLRRDTQGLERALQDAGLKTSDNSLQFSLRDQTQQNQQNERESQSGRQPAAEDELATTLTTTVIARDYGRYSLRPSGVDIRV